MGDRSRDSTVGERGAPVKNWTLVSLRFRLPLVIEGIFFTINLWILSKSSLTMWQTGTHLALWCAVDTAVSVVPAWSSVRPCSAVGARPEFVAVGAAPPEVVYRCSYSAGLVTRSPPRFDRYCRRGDVSGSKVALL